MFMITAFVFNIIIFVLFMVVVFIMLFYFSRNKMIEININNKKEFLENIKACFSQLRWHFESETENLITYKYRYSRVSINFNQNKATIIGPKIIVDKLMNLYGKKKFE